MKMTNLVWPFVLLTAFPACTEIGLDYQKEEGTVVIAPDWSAFACPASACYRFYAAGSEEAAYEGEDASAESFSLVLPVGGYHCWPTTQMHAELLLRGWSIEVRRKSALLRRRSPAAYIAGAWTMWRFPCGVRCSIRLCPAAW